MLQCHRKVIPFPFGELILLENKAFLIALCPPEKLEQQLKKLRTLYKEDLILSEEETPLLYEAAAQLKDYFSGRRTNFDLPLHPIGSAFQQKVWQQLLTIPYGKTTTYGALCAKLNSKAYQALGNAVGANPLPILIPCHRVLPVNGKIGNFSLCGGSEAKAFLLDLEGAVYQK